MSLLASLGVCVSSTNVTKGAFIGGFVVLIDTRIRKKKIEKGGKEMEPEDRLPLAMIGGVGFAVTMFWFAWTAEYK